MKEIYIGLDDKLNEHIFALTKKGWLDIFSLNTFSNEKVKGNFFKLKKVLNCNFKTKSKIKKCYEKDRNKEIDYRNLYVGKVNVISNINNTGNRTYETYPKAGGKIIL